MKSIKIFLSGIITYLVVSNVTIGGVEMAFRQAVNELKFLESNLAVKSQNLSTEWSTTSQNLEPKIITIKADRVYRSFKLEESEEFANYEFPKDTKLIKIYSNNFIKDIGSIKEKLTKLHNFPELHLCFIKPHPSIISELYKLQNLTQLSLYMYSSNISNESAQSIAHGLANLPNLLQLDFNLNANHIGDEGAKAIGTALEKLKTLTTLKLGLHNNKIGYEGAKSIVAGLQNLTGLDHLELGLNYNNIGDEGAKAIANGLGITNLSQLGLWLSDNNIGNEGAELIVKELKNLKLEDLYLNLGEKYEDIIMQELGKKAVDFFDFLSAK